MRKKIIMKKFFLNQDTNLFISLFSKYHICLVMLCFLLVCLIINNKEKFINISNNKKTVLRYVLAILLMTNFLLRRGSFIYYGVYDWRYHLDINFCNFTSIIIFIYCITGNKKIYEICYYMVFIGPFLSIIFPSVNFSPFNYSFYSFIVLHHIVFIFNIIFMYSEKLKYNKNNFKKAIFFLIIYFCLIYLFNIFFNTRYNTPITFLNQSIKNNNSIYNYLSCFYIDYIIMFVIIWLLITFAKKVLQKIIIKNNF